MAKLLGVSRATIKNKMTEMIAPVTDKNVLEECNKKVDEMRSRWIKLIERNPEKTLFQLSKINRKLHYWLYKNDYLWMKENTPTTIPKASVIRQYDWKEKDEELLVEVQGIISEWDKYEYDKLRKISKFSIARKLTSPHLIIKKTDKIPKTMNFIEYHIESDEDFRIRKLNEAYKTLLRQGEGLNFSTLVKESKINSQQLTSEIESYAKALINNN